MATQRTADILLGAFQDEMVTRRKFDVKNSKGEVKLSLWFKPITRYARVKAQQIAGKDADALVVSTQLLCQMAEKKMEHQLLICQMHLFYRELFLKKY